MVVVVALGVALWTQLGDDASPTGSIGPGQARDRRDADTAEALAGPRARADLAPCPARRDAGPAVREPLRGITLECAGDGTGGRRQGRRRPDDRPQPVGLLVCAVR